LAVFAHSGVVLPYQLHAWPPTATELEDERGVELGRTEETGGVEEACALDELRGALDGATLEAGALEVTVELHTAPVMVGTCALVPPLVPCTPNSTLEFAPMVPFQLSGAAVYGLEPPRVAFQLLV